MDQAVTESSIGRNGRNGRPRIAVVGESSQTGFQDLKAGIFPVGLVGGDVRRGFGCGSDGSLIGSVFIHTGKLRWRGSTVSGRGETDQDRGPHGPQIFISVPSKRPVRHR